MARYVADNFRASRTWGVSATSPWEFGHFWRPRDGVDRRRKDLSVDWDRLQRPGFSPDYVDLPYERMDLAFGRSSPPIRRLMSPGSSKVPRRPTG